MALALSLTSLDYSERELRRALDVADTAVGRKGEPH